MSKEMRKHIDTFKKFLIKETFFDLNTDFKQSLNKLDRKDKIDFTKSKLIINDGDVKKGFNKVYLDGNEVGSFVIDSIGTFNDVHNKKKYNNSIFLQGGFLIKNEFKYMGIGKEVIKTIFEKTGVDNIFLYAVDWQGSVDFWKKIGGDVIFRDDEKELNLIRIKK
jgi:predicted acetyltransferase